MYTPDFSRPIVKQILRKSESACTVLLALQNFLEIYGSSKTPTAELLGVTRQTFNTGYQYLKRVGGVYQEDIGGLRWLTFYTLLLYIPDGSATDNQLTMPKSADKTMTMPRDKTMTKEKMSVTREPFFSKSVEQVTKEEVFALAKRYKVDQARLAYFWEQKVLGERSRNQFMPIRDAEASLTKLAMELALKTYTPKQQDIVKNWVAIQKEKGHHAQ